jgi:hypothetical protein
MSQYFNNFVYAVILSFLFASVMSYNRNFTFQNTTNSTFNSTGLECDLCQFVTQEAEGLLLSNKTLNEIETELDTLCQQTKHNKICEYVVDTYIPKIIYFLEQEESPEQVCKQIDIC